jgi:splicing factor 3B subunit 3
MYLYHLTVKGNTAITQAICGNFSGAKVQEICVAKGNLLELLKPDENGKLQSLLEVEIFGSIRSIVPFRLTGN